MQTPRHAKFVLAAGLLVTSALACIGSVQVRDVARTCENGGPCQEPNSTVRRFMADCEARLAAACVSAAEAFKNAEGAPAELGQFAHYARRACDLGALPMCSELAFGAASDGGTPLPDEVRSFALERACELGDGRACHELARGTLLQPADIATLELFVDNAGYRSSSDPLAFRMPVDPADAQSAAYSRPVFRMLERALLAKEAVVHLTPDCRWQVAAPLLNAARLVLTDAGHWVVLSDGDRRVPIDVEFASAARDGGVTLPELLFDSSGFRIRTDAGWIPVRDGGVAEILDAGSVGLNIGPDVDARSFVPTLDALSGVAEIRPQPFDPADGGVWAVGGISKELIARAMKRQKPSLTACYQFLLDRRQVEGKVSVHFIIGPKGDVVFARPESNTTGVDALGECIASRFTRIQFPKPQGGGVVNVVYPFVFTMKSR